MTKSLKRSVYFRFPKWELFREDIFRAFGVANYDVSPCARFDSHIMIPSADWAMATIESVMPGGQGRRQNGEQCRQPMASA